MDLDSLHNMSDTCTWFVCKKMMRWPAPQDPCSFCRVHLQGQMASLESQLSQSQRTAADLQLQVSSLETERQQLEQALQGAHAEIQTLRGTAG